MHCPFSKLKKGKKGYSCCILKQIYEAMAMKCRHICIAGWNQVRVKYIPCEHSKRLRPISVTLLEPFFIFSWNNIATLLKIS